MTEKVLACGDKVGTLAGFARHDRAGDDPCDSCKAAKRADNRQRQKVRRLDPTKRRRDAMIRNLHTRFVMGYLRRTDRELYDGFLADARRLTNEKLKGETDAAPAESDTEEG